MSPASTERPRDAARPTPGLAAAAGVAAASLPAAAVLAMRDAVRARREGRGAAAWLRAAAALAADDARGRGLPPEAMIVALKRELAGLEEARDLPGHDVQALLDRLVTLGIAAYFPDRSAADRSVAPAESPPHGRRAG